MTFGLFYTTACLTSFSCYFGGVSIGSSIFFVGLYSLLGLAAFYFGDAGTLTGSILISSCFSIFFSNFFSTFTSS